MANFVGRKQEIQKICKFLEEPPHETGGVLLVTGERGSGKTRLVDEALNKKVQDTSNKIHQPKQKLFDLFGNANTRKKQLIKRSPRQQNRFIIPVSVDPFFPHEVTCNADNKDNTSITKDPRSQLLKNIIFSLTSTLDPRVSVRRHGRTLRERLGFWDYWFSSNAIWGSSAFLSNHRLSSKGLFFFLYFLFFILISIVLSFHFEFSNSNIYSGIGSFLQQLLLWSLLFPIAWILLRAYDWYALAKHSGRLYDLVHADEAQQSLHAETFRELNASAEADKKKSVLEIILAITLIAFFSHFFPDILQKIKTETPDKITTPLLLALSFTTIILIARFIISINNKRKWHRDFGTQNPAWRVTLLRRYLHLLHRCGIEPVLVIDELDKLDKQFFPSQKNANESDDNTNLRNFITAFAMLKQSLGAHFFWILIDEYRIHNEVEKARHTSPQGVAATLIQETILLGPIPFDDANTYFDTSSNKLDEKHKAYYWIKSKGLFSNLRQFENLTLPDHLLSRANKLKKSINKLWNFRSSALASFFSNNDHYEYDLSNNQYVDFIRIGIMQFAQELLLWESYYPDNQFMEPYLEKISSGISAPIKFDLKSTSFEEFINLGKAFLYTELFNNDELIVLTDNLVKLRNN